MRSIFTKLFFVLFLIFSLLLVLKSSHIIPVVMSLFQTDIEKPVFSPACSNAFKEVEIQMEMLSETTTRVHLKNKGSRILVIENAQSVSNSFPNQNSGELNPYLKPGEEMKLRIYRAGHWFAIVAYQKDWGDFGSDNACKVEFRKLYREKCKQLFSQSCD